MADNRYKRPPFSPSFLFIATRALTLNGVELKAGDDVNTDGILLPRVRQLYDARRIDARLDEHGYPLVRGVAVLEQIQEPIAPPPPADDDTDTRTGFLVGVVNSLGEGQTLADLPEDELRRLALDLEIEGAALLPLADLVAAISAIPLEIPKGDENGPDSVIPPVDGPTPGPIPQIAPQATPEPVKPNAAALAEMPVAGRYHAEHRGAGRWYVIDSTTKEPVGEPTAKAEAVARAAELNA